MKRGKYVHLNEALRLMDKFGYLTEANPNQGFGGGSSGGGGASGGYSNSNSGNNNSQGGNTSQGGTYRNDQPAVISDQSVVPYEPQEGDDGKGPQKDRTGSLFWLAMRDMGYHFNEYIKRPIEYDEEGLEGDAVGTVCLVVKDGNDESFRIVIGEDQTLVYQDPNGAVIPMCRMNQGRRRRLNCSRYSMNEAGGTHRVNTNRLKSRYGVGNSSPQGGGNNQTQQGNGQQGNNHGNGQQGPAMTREKVDPNDKNVGGIVRMGQFWLFLKTLQKGSDARLSGAKDGGNEIAEILDDFAEWFAEQEKETEMPEANMSDSEFGQYIHQALLQGGPRVVVADTGQTFRISSDIQTVNNKQVLCINAYSGQDMPLGKYVNAECNPTNDGCEGKIYCGSTKKDTYVAFKYLVNLNVVLFHTSLNGNTTNWVQNCQGTLVTMIINYYQQKFGPNAQQGGNNAQNAQQGNANPNNSSNTYNSGVGAPQNQQNVAAAEQQIMNDINNYWSNFVGWNNNMSEVVRGNRISLYAISQGNVINYTTVYYHNGQSYPLGELNSVKMYQNAQGDVLASLIFPSGQLFVGKTGDFVVKYQNGVKIHDTDTIQGNFINIVTNGISMV